MQTHEKVLPEPEQGDGIFLGLQVSLPEMPLQGVPGPPREAGTAPHMLTLVGCCILGLVALGSSYVCAFLFKLGAEKNWSSVGPSVLVVKMGMSLTALVCLASSGLLVCSLLGWRFPSLRKPLILLRRILESA